MQQEVPKDLTLAEIKGIVEQFDVLDRVVLHGVGEPLLNPELFEIIAYLKEAKGASVLFNSDAISLTPKRARKLIDSGLDEIRVSMDSATAQTYRMVRGVDQFDRVVKNVRNLIDQQQELGVEDPKVSLWFVAMKTNLADLPEFVRLADRAGVREVYLQRLVTTMAGRAGHGLAIDGQSMHGSLADEQERLIEESTALADELGIDFKASGMKDPLESLKPEDRKRHWSTCQRPWSLSYITSNGNVLPCNISACTAKDYKGAILGNALTDDFQSIWNGERYQDFRERFESDVAPDPCEGCGLKWSI
jgi:radical SAM protein with 4Fe4S-binding SPASM domain